MSELITCVNESPFEATGAALAGVLLGTAAGWIGWWIAFLIWRYWL